LLYYFFNLDARWRLVVNSTPRLLYTWKRDPLPIVQVAGWYPRRVWMGAKNLASTGIWFPCSPARSQSLYRIRYPGPHPEKL
jgi:hypothetical protein